MSKASNAALEALHNALAETLAKAITEGVPVKDEEGNIVTLPAPAAILNVARQFLKDNGIEAQAVPESPLARITQGLPFPTKEESQRPN